MAKEKRTGPGLDSEPSREEEPASPFLELPSGRRVIRFNSIKERMTVRNPPHNGRLGGIHERPATAIVKFAIAMKEKPLEITGSILKLSTQRQSPLGDIFGLLALEIKDGDEVEVTLSGRQTPETFKRVAALIKDLLQDEDSLESAKPGPGYFDALSEIGKNFDNAGSATPAVPSFANQQSGEGMASEGKPAAVLQNLTQLPGNEELISLHKLMLSGAMSKLRQRGFKVMLSENLFRPEDVSALRSVLDKELIEIASAEEVRSAATNRTAASEKVGCIVTREDFRKYWDTPSVRANTKATMVVLNMNDIKRETDDKDFAYIYIEGLIDLASAMAEKNADRIRKYLEVLFDMAAFDVKTLDEYLKDSDSIKFAINAVLRLKPMDKVDAKRFDEYKQNANKLLEAA